ncbi:hypothetical protein GBAR_LOCUS24152 [Geodia barretti]|uniref:Uncharacterized protein n=1 Tax=Geodia barretti TaxID=519541 RepID=A0AA35T9X8_GEOBA|nr:hypothetical protein GBAR_LOCUS24152 [Geodia barretti]
MAQHHLLLAALLQLLRIASGDGEMSLVLPETGYCGEAISGNCTARDSTRLTLDISGLNYHTFTPEGSQKSVVLEGVSLDVVELTPTQDKFKFVVSISYTLEKTLTISCRNDKVDEIHKVYCQSGNLLVRPPLNMSQTSSIDSVGETKVSRVGAGPSLHHQDFDRGRHY